MDKPVEKATTKKRRVSRIPQPPKTPHSMRVYDHIWESARRRATHEGYNMNQVLSTLLRGYSEGKIDMPREVF